MADVPDITRRFDDACPGKGAVLQPDLPDPVARMLAGPPVPAEEMSKGFGVANAGKNSTPSRSPTPLEGVDDFNVGCGGGCSRSPQ